MDIVLPLLEHDLERYEVLQRPTFERWYADLATTWVVVTAAEARDIERRLRHLPGVRVVREDDLVPEQRWVRRLWRGERSRRWYLQQLIKLAAVEHSETPFCLVLDADVLAVRSVSDADLVVANRALRPRDPPDDHPDWVRNAATALGMGALEYSSSVTPSVLARDGVRLLAEYAAESLRPRRTLHRWGSRLPLVSRPLSTWRGRLLGVLPWTEYQLYDTFLAGAGRMEQFHYTSSDQVLYDNCVWWPEQYSSWDPMADTGRRYSFSVVQSWLGIPIASMSERLRGAGVLP